MRPLLIAVLAAVAWGCEDKRGKAPTEGAGPAARRVSPSGSVLLAPGTAADLRLSNDLAYAAYLLDGKRPRLEGVAETLLVGELNLLPLDGGEPVAVAQGVSNNPGGHFFSPDSRYLLALGGYSPATQAGTLEVFPVKEPKNKARLGDQVTFVTLSADGRRVAFLDGGVLKVGELGSGTYREVGTEVISARFARDGQLVVFHRKVSAGAELLAVEPGKEGPPVKLAQQVAEYQIAADSRTVAYTLRPSASSYGDLYLSVLPRPKARKVASGTSVFAFSPDGKWLARTEGAKPHRNGDLFVGPSDGAPGTRVGQRVFELKFAPDSSAVAFRENYDTKTSTGKMAVADLGTMKTTRLGDRAPNYEWAPEGKLLAFQRRIIHPIPIVQLMVHRLGEEAPTRIADDVFGYLFGPGNGHLLYRDQCTRGLDACKLSALDLDRLAEPARELFEDAYSFRFSQDGSRALVTFRRIDGRDLYDLYAVELKTGARKKLDERASVPAYFAAKDGSKVAFIAADPARPGVYLAEAVAPVAAQQ